MNSLSNLGQGDTPKLGFVGDLVYFLGVIPVIHIGGLHPKK